VIDKRIPRRAGHEPVHFDGTAAADTAYDLREAGASIDTPLSGQWAFHIDGSWRESDDVALAGRGTLANSATETRSYGAGLAWIGDGANLGVSAGRYKTDYGVPAPPGEEEDVSIGLRQTRYDLRGALDIDAFYSAQNVERATAFLNATLRR
jgi:iron complex outermembrane receptor protein